MKARMRSIYDALDLIKQKAQDTALTYNSIINLYLTDKLRYFLSGKKIILNYDDLVAFLGMEER